MNWVSTRGALGDFGVGLGHFGRVGQVHALVFGLLRHLQTPLSVRGWFNDHPRIANHPTGIGFTRQPSSLFKVVQMGNCFTHREHGLVCIELPVEQRVQQFCCALWRLFTAISRARRRSSWCACKSPTLLHPVKGKPCEGSTSVSAGISRARSSSDSRYQRSASASGVAAKTPILVEILGKSMSPEINTPSSTQ